MLTKPSQNDVFIDAEFPFPFQYGDDQSLAFARFAV
jgi:hypothetical protein